MEFKYNIAHWNCKISNYYLTIYMEFLKNNVINIENK